jgi:hypothetical protein
MSSPHQRRRASQAAFIDANTLLQESLNSFLVSCLHGIHEGEIGHSGETARR